MPPKRKHGKDLPPNLYPATDKRDGVTRYRYRDPRNGRYYGMGTDKASAVADAKALNAIIAQDMSRARVAFITNPVADTPKLSAVILEHMVPMQTRRIDVFAIYEAGFGGFEGSKIPRFSVCLHSIKSRCYKIVLQGI